VGSSGDDGERRFLLTLVSLSDDPSGDFNMRSEALIGDSEGESTVEISTSSFFRTAGMHN
jgi:hypothetical protein